MDMNLLEMVQHKMLRYLALKMGTEMSRLDHDYSEIAVRCNLPTIKSLHAVNDCVLAYKFVYGLIPGAFVSTLFPAKQNIPYSLRNPRFLFESLPKSKGGFFSCVNRIRRTWNGLTRDLKNCESISTFKTRIRSFYCSFSWMLLFSKLGTVSSHNVTFSHMC